MAHVQFEGDSPSLPLTTAAQHAPPSSRHLVTSPARAGMFRYVLMLLMHLGLQVTYALRVNMSVAVIPLAKTYDWSESQRGWVLSSFFIGYLFNQVPGGWLSARFGGKVVFGISICVTSALTLGVPLVVRHLWLLVALRVLTGFAEGATYPSVHKLLGEWMPIPEQSIGVSLVWSGAYLGTVVSELAAPLLIKLLGWPSVFYAFGGAGIVWTALWVVLASPTPATNAWMSAAERSYIVANQLPPRKDDGPVPWSRLLTCRAVWAIVAIHTANNYTFYTLLSWLPTFLSSALGYDIELVGIFSMLSYLLLTVIAIGTGFLMDHLITTIHMQKTFIRKVVMVVGVLPSAALLFVIGYVPTTLGWVAVLMMIFSIGVNGAASPAFGANMLDVAPRYAGVVMAISNTAATVPGIVGVYIAGVLLEASWGGWLAVFQISSAVSLSGLAIYLTFASGNQHV